MNIDININDIHKIQRYTNTKQFLLESELKRLQLELDKMNKRIIQLQERALKFSQHGTEFKKSIYVKVKAIAENNLNDIRKMVKKYMERRRQLIKHNQESIMNVRNTIEECNSSILRLEELLQLIKIKKIKYDELLVLIQDSV